ncbi:MFS transporter [Priestia megaterium]|nr:MFS transporter [Priestia megaterium]
MRWIVLGFLFILFLINFADRSVIGYANIPIMEDLGLTYAQMGLVASCFYWLYSVAGVAGGALSDKIGPKKMLTIMALAWTVLQFSALAIYSFPLLILSRVLLGVFEGPFSAIAISQLSKWFPPEKRGFAISILNSGGTIGAFVIAPIVVSLITAFGWRIAFGALGLVSLVWAVIWVWIGKENPAKEPVQQEAAKPKKPAQKAKWKDIRPVLLTPTFIFTCLAYFSCASLLTWVTAWQPTFFIKVTEMTPAQMGYASVIVGIGSVVLNASLSLFSDQLFKKNQSYRISRVFVTAIALVLAACLLFTLTTIESAILAVVILTFAKGLGYTIFVMGPQIVNSLLPERSGLMSGILIGFGNTAGIIVPLVTGILVQSAADNVRIGFNYSLILVASLMVVLGTLFLIFAKPDKKVTSSQLVEETSAV